MDKETTKTRKPTQEEREQIKREPVRETRQGYQRSDLERRDYEKR